MKPAAQCGRKAVSASRAVSDSSRSCLARLAIGLLIQQIRKECETFIMARDMAISFLKRGLALGKEIYLIARREFIEHMDHLTNLWGQIDSSHQFEWEPQMPYPFARKVVSDRLVLSV